MLHKLRKYLLAPLIYTAAILLLFEEYLWRACKRCMARFPLLPVVARLEARISALPPFAALAIFVLPSLLLLPVKLIALMSIAHGHPSLGLIIVIAAKILGTALVAWLYSLTESALTCLPWFARWRDALLRFKDRVIAQLRATHAWQQVEAGMAALNAARKYCWSAWQQRWHNAGRSRGNRLLRVIKKYAATRRNRRDRR